MYCAMKKMKKQGKAHSLHIIAMIINLVKSNLTKL